MIKDFIIAYKSKLYFYLEDERASFLTCGMIQGICQLMSNFSPENVEIVRGTIFTLHVLCPEPQLFIILKVINASTSASDDHLKSYLKRAWDWYYLFNGSSISREKCLVFFSRYLCCAGNQWSLFNTLPMISFMPLKADDYLSLKDLHIEIMDQFPILNRSLILWKHFLAYSSLQSEKDAWILYDYLTHPETGKVEDGLIDQVKDKAQPIISTRQLGWCYDTGKHSNSSNTFVGYLVAYPNKFVHTSFGKQILLLYQSRDWLFTFLIDSNHKDQLSQSFLDSLAHQLDKINDLNSVFIKSYSSNSRILDGISDFRFFYYNDKTLAYKTTCKGFDGISVKLEIALDSIIHEINSGCNFIIQRSVDDLWLIGRKILGRSLYLILPKTDSPESAMEIFDSICARSFPELEANSL